MSNEMQKKFFDAIDNGLVSEIEMLLQQGADVNMRDEEQRTPLIAASYFGKEPILELLIQANSDINAKDSYGNTPLITAIDGGEVDTLRLFLRNNADPNIQDNYGMTALAVAVRDPFLDATSQLLKHNADPNIADNDGETPLFSALRGWDERTFALTKNSLSMQENSFGGILFLNSLLRTDHLSAIAILLAHNANPNAANYAKVTPIMLAAALGNVAAVELLLKFGANPKAKAFDHATALDFAKHNKHTKIIDLLS